MGGGREMSVEEKVFLITGIILVLIMIAKWWTDGMK